MSTSCTSSASRPGAGAAASNGAIGTGRIGTGAAFASLDLVGSVTELNGSARGMDDDAFKAGAASSSGGGGGRRNKRKNFQPRNIRHGDDDEQPLDLTETDGSTNGASLRKRSKLLSTDEDEDGGSTASSAEAVDLSVPMRPSSAVSSECDDEASLKMNMLLWQRGQLLAQLHPGAELRHIIAGLYSLPGRETLDGLDPRLPLQELQAVAKNASNGPAQSPVLLHHQHPSPNEHPSTVVPRSIESLTNEAPLPASPSASQLPSVYDSPLYKQKPIVDGPRPSSSGEVKRPAGPAATKNNSPIDYSRYVKRFASAIECGSTYCKDYSYREHFHCLECQSRVFVKKEEMIRHFKWHKKRDESLQHGFMRYSPGDDCNDRYSNCPHNRKQTHYHCVKTGCDKVYISTSDVQMHANYHRKDSAIIQEGFQRFRATEDCATAHCAFNGQRTTHFHCRRAPCNYTFKNKADMEKHKSYHIKDEQLARDGFKKFMKNEACNFENCRFSRVCNHIHCIRSGCNYVLHSSGQLYSHKRKHERRDAELAYNEGNSSNQLTSSNEATPLAPKLEVQPTFAAFGGIPDVSYLMRDPSVAAALLYGRLPPAILNQIDPRYLNVKPEEPTSGMPNACPVADCQLKLSEHYHCAYPECKRTTLRSMESLREHELKHEKQDRITGSFYISIEEDDESNSCPTECPHQKLPHYHCIYDGCQEVVLPSDEVFKRLDHYKAHETRPVSTPTTSSPQKSANNSLDSMFRRKRGRPPKNRVIEVWNDSPLGPDTPQAIFTSFKLPKPATPPLGTVGPLTNPGLVRPASPESKRKEPPPAKIVQSAIRETSRSPDSPSKSLTVVKASGTFFPSPAPPSRDDLNNSRHESPVSGNEGLDLSQGSLASRPSSSLETSDSPPMDESKLANASQEDASLTYGAELSCGRPFCKLKKREHYHCAVCNQAFSEIEKLKSHVLKHCNGALSPNMSHLVAQSVSQTDSKSTEEQHKVESQRSPVEPGPSLLRETPEPSEAILARTNPILMGFAQLPGSYGLPFHQSLAKSPGLLPTMQSLYANSGFAMNGSAGSSGLGPPVDQTVADAKKMRIQSSMRILKDEPVPEGYVRFRFNEDCQYPICGYREHQTHFHCMRRDCGYSFCDKTRFVQHTARHERLDTLMGGDFTQYRANVNCGRPGCLYTANLAAGQNKASHFHCLKCDFVCTDTNKVVAHRRQHQKTDSILAAGFEKFTPSQGCRVDGCPHSTKQTHYHCLKCSYAVLGLAQMSAHKYRHMENPSTP